MENNSENKNPAVGQGPKRREAVNINYSTGMMFVPGVGEVPLVGPTSGVELERLKRAHEQWQADKELVKSLLRANWQCQQCRRKQKGTGVRIKMKRIGGYDITIFVCVDRHCDGPVLLLDEQPASVLGDKQGKGKDPDKGLVTTPDKGTGIVP